MWFVQVVQAAWAEREGLADDLRQKSLLQDVLAGTV